MLPPLQNALSTTAENTSKWRRDQLDATNSYLLVINNWLPIHHYLLHLVGLAFIYLSKMHSHSNTKFAENTVYSLELFRNCWKLRACTHSTPNTSFFIMKRDSMNNFWIFCTPILVVLRFHLSTK